MAEELPGAASAEVEIDRILLDAKLAIPPLRRGSVSRAELIEAARTSDSRVVSVTAPPGYGKSTLLAEWARAEDRPVAWVSLDRLDDDPSVLLTLVASAYAQISPGNSDLVSDMGGLGTSMLGRAAPRLASALSRSPVPFVIMLDDLQELQSPACHDVLGVVVSGIPRSSQLVAASRSEQPHVARLRASGDAIELRAADLALDVAGAEQIFAEAHATITPELVAEVTERTEGWPVGLYLAALITREASSAELTVHGDDRYVADYLYGEYLARQPEEVRRFLRRTAVLDHLCAPLCDALGGGSGAQERLRRLEDSNQFLIPLDRRRGWYRYHALFREFLLAELRRVEPEVIMKLHLRAADWFEGNGAPALAVEHLLETTERNRCVQLVTTLILPTYQIGQMSTVQRWLSALGDAAIEGYPPLAVLATWVVALTGQTTDAQKWAAIVDAASFELVPLDGSASFDSARAMVRAVMCPSGPDQAMADATLAMGQEPAWSPWRDTAVLLCAEAHLLVGDVERAVTLFEESSATAAAAGNTDAVVLSESELASIAMDSLRWSEAADHLQVALAAAERARMDDYAVSVSAFAGAARLALQRGDAMEAHRQLTRAMRARPSLTFAMPYLAVRTRLQLAKVHWAAGDHTTARHLLREIDDIMLRRPALGVLGDQVSDFRRSVTSHTQAKSVSSVPLTPAELRLMPYLQTHLTIREIAERLFVSRNTVSSEVGSIYRKLGVSSRSGAVEHATVLGLLGGVVSGLLSG